MSLLAMHSGYYDYNRRVVTWLVREKYLKERKFRDYEDHMVRSLSLTKKGIEQIQKEAPVHAEVILSHELSPANGQGDWKKTLRLHRSAACFLAASQAGAYWVPGEEKDARSKTQLTYYGAYEFNTRFEKDNKGSRASGFLVRGNQLYALDFLGDHNMRWTEASEEAFRDQVLSSPIGRGRYFAGNILIGNEWDLAESLVTHGVNRHTRMISMKTDLPLYYISNDVMGIKLLRAITNPLADSRLYQWFNQYKIFEHDVTGGPLFDLTYVSCFYRAPNNQKFELTPAAGYGLDGKKVRCRTTYKPDANMSEKQADKAAQKEAFRFEQQLEQGYVVEDNQRFQEYAEYVPELKLRNGLKRSTYERYLTLLPKINEAIGTMRLRDIRPMHLNNLYGQLSKPGVRTASSKAVATKDVESILKKMKMSKSALAKNAGGSPQVVTAICRKQPVLKKAGESVAKALGKDYSRLFRTEVDQTPLSTKTVLEYHRLTCAILSQAEKEMLVPYNAAKKATPPKNQQKDVNYFQPVQICDILEALEDEPLKWQLITHLLMITVARRGEIAGLKWSKFDMEKRRLKVDTALLCSTKIGIYETTTKTSNQRYIPLPDETFVLLKRYRISQMELQLANGDRWVHTDYVFTKSDGSPIGPDAITQWLAKFSKRKNLPHINPHAFRHTAASVRISQGMDVVTVSKMLGHAKVSTTEDIYSHVIEESKQQASNALAEVYFRRKVAEN